MKEDRYVLEQLHTIFQKILFQSRVFSRINRSRILEKHLQKLQLEEYGFR